MAHTECLPLHSLRTTNFAFLQFCNFLLIVEARQRPEPFLSYLLAQSHTLSLHLPQTATLIPQQQHIRGNHDTICFHLTGSLHTDSTIAFLFLRAANERHISRNDFGSFASPAP